MDKSEVRFGIIFVNNTKLIEAMTSRINQNILFVDVRTWKSYEHYEINNIKVMRNLGYFDSDQNYISINNSSFEERRKNFQGYHTKAITEVIIPYINLETSSAKFDEKSQTYDVTESVHGLHYDLFMLMQKQLNFTATLHKRKDGKWGPTKVFQNGSVLTGGIIESVASRFAEILVSG